MVEGLQALERRQQLMEDCCVAVQEEERLDQIWRELQEVVQDGCRVMQGWGAGGGYSVVDMRVLEQDLPLHCETRGQQAIFESGW